MFIRIPGEQWSMSSEKTKSLLSYNLDVCIIYLSLYIHFDLSVGDGVLTPFTRSTKTHCLKEWEAPEQRDLQNKDKIYQRKGFPDGSVVK